ncbi:PHP domain-like protein [Artomyces pyxidatus]|uniref:PHP domain-like protein n=1 Tax=Artomyces pyxidatus TaxID=48021 RepID=A0ACB8SGY8_9AGAM|nr:PHP domain-like protein [Artomyces pyxidatus]
MYFDLNVPVPSPASSSGSGQSQSKKGKGKQHQQQQQQQSSSSSTSPLYSPAQINAVEARVDLLVHLGYTVIAFSQTLLKKIEPKTFVNTLDPLLEQLRKRPGIVYLRRLTLILDEDSEKGFGLTNANASLVASYDLLALTATTEATFSLACLTHTLPSPLTTHIISLPLTLPRLPFRLKHTLVRTALRNGAVFEITYSGAVRAGEGESSGNAATKRNWWAAAQEVVRVTKGKGIVLSGGAAEVAELRAPKDVGNLITFLGLAQNLAHDTATTTPKSVVLRAQTRKTYRAVFSEPRVVIPDAPPPHPVAKDPAPLPSEPTAQQPSDVQMVPNTAAPQPSSSMSLNDSTLKKRTRDEGESEKTEGIRQKKKGKKAGNA